ncbi:AfsR/SARP family transcriptional regulator [Nocardioides sp. URHA0020]|uniref:AfsR/SARP family transcriptional regulator n=1 Tax=Nocardioides sp. URHA0020 TaxID=1380392 RepID=UPI00055F4E14|nr:bacterial transcriptional activator domain-containing protein [Nocardioides sp. URHA0020]
MLEPPGLPPGPRLRLLGRWQLTATPQLPKSGVSRDARRLLTLLALHGAADRDAVRRQLWPGSEAPASAARLRNSLWRLAKARAALLHEDRGALSLRSCVDVDVDELFTAAAAIDQGLEGLGPELFEADLLPGWDEDWLVVDRERIRQLRLHALERLSERHLRARRYDLALDAALAAVHADPLRESAHRSVIGVHLAEANVVEAIHQFERCRSILADELGVRPSSALQSMMAGCGTISSRE